MVDTKDVLYRYFELHEKTTNIAKALNVVPSYITKVVKKDERYNKEKEYRTNLSNEKRKKDKRDWIRNKRQNDTNKELYEFVKMQHIQASNELSYSLTLSDWAFKKWNFGAYHTNSNGNFVLNRNLNVSYDVAKKLNTHIKIPTQKYNKQYYFSV